jgi:hypothetical protein
VAIHRRRQRKWGHPRLTRHPSPLLLWLRSRAPVRSLRANHSETEFARQRGRACEMKADTATRAAVSVVHRLMVFLMIVLIGPLRLANHAVDRLHAEMPSGRSAELQGDVRKLDVRSSGDADLQRG